MMPDHATHTGHVQPTQSTGPAAATGGMPAHASMTAQEGMADARHPSMSHGQSTPWPHFANMVLGLWLITGAFALDYRSPGLEVSDVVSGAVVIELAILSLTGRSLARFWAPWANSFA